MTTVIASALFVGMATQAAADDPKPFVPPPFDPHGGLSAAPDSTPRLNLVGRPGLRLPDLGQNRKSGSGTPTEYPGEADAGFSIAAKLGIVGVYSGHDAQLNVVLPVGVDQTLYAPTMVGPNPFADVGFGCLETVTAHWRFSGFTDTAHGHGFWDHCVTGGWVSFKYIGDPTFKSNYVRVFDDEERYFTQVDESSGVWYGRLFNFNTGQWETQATVNSSIGACCKVPGGGWTAFETYGLAAAGCPSVPAIRSAEVQVLIDSVGWRRLTWDNGGSVFWYGPCFTTGPYRLHFNVHPSDWWVEYYAPVAQTAPPLTDSWYVSQHWYNTFNPYTSNGQSIWWNFGYYMPNNGRSVILDFGAPCKVGNAWGLETWQFGCMSYTAIRDAVVSIQSGYDLAIGRTLPLELVIGINSSVFVPLWDYRDAGREFARTIAGITPSTFVTAQAGIDAEPEDTWPIAGLVAVPFAQGFSDVYPTLSRPTFLYDFGWLRESSYDPTTHTPTYPPGWTAEDQNNLNWGFVASYPYLEQYAASWATMLQHLDLYSAFNTRYGPWYVRHVLAGETFQGPVSAWDSVLSALQNSGCGCTQQVTIDHLSWIRTLQ